jgi:hypothetical protein
MRRFITKILVKLNLINLEYVVVNFLEKHKVYYLHLINDDNIEDTFIGGNEKCSPELIASFILYNLSVNNSENVIAHLYDSEDSNIDGKKVLDEYTNLVKKQYESILSDIKKSEKNVDSFEDPVINPLDVYNSAKVIK